MGEDLSGFVSTNCGRTSVGVSFGAEGRALISVFARWMGDDAALDVVLDCRHEPLGSHSGTLILEGATEANQPIALPPSDGAIMIEYVRVPPQTSSGVGGDTMRVVGMRTEVFTMVLWLHPDAMFDDGTDLEPNEYDVPPERFRPTARALKWLVQPWKLG